MNRLTKKNDIGYFPAYERETKENYYDLVHKLGVLEDIEEENGIDLITLFKALKDGFYIKYNDKIVHILPKFFIDCKKGTDYLSETIDEEYWFKDYGETWALTREELENEI